MALLTVVGLPPLAKDTQCLDSSERMKWQGAFLAYGRVSQTYSGDPMRMQKILSSVAILFAAIGSNISCQSHPDGYWTKPDRSQALTNEEYSVDSGECQALVESTSAEEAPATQANLFTHCMQARGYKWIVETQASHPVKKAAQQAALQCSNGRLITDAFGYQKCVPHGTKDGGILQEARRAIPPHVHSQDHVSPSTVPLTQPANGQAKDDFLCRQYAKESLSSTYAVYSQCMRDKGWAAEP